MTPTSKLPKQPILLSQHQIIAKKFSSIFKVAPQLVVACPGRINLIGEHTDYNNGFVLPAAIDKMITIAISRRKDNLLHFVAVDFDQQFKGKLDKLDRSPQLWPDYINGVLEQFRKKNFAIGGLNIVIGGDIPAGAGLSSSAALECGIAFGLNELFDLDLDKFQLVKMAQAAENEFVGVRCGIMDQFASMFGKEGHAILLDCRSLKYEYVPLDLHQHEILLMDTRVKHSLAAGEYNVRRKQCEQGVTALRKVYPQVESLRDANRAMIEYTLKDLVPETIYNRCKYVVEENLRLQVGCEALRRNDIVTFGKKMYASHMGLSKLYEVSCPELDYLVDLAREEYSIAGARMMGGGFGGCTINIVKKSSINEVIERMSTAFKARFGIEPLAYKCNLSNGTYAVSGKK